MRDKEIDDLIKSYLKSRTSSDMFSIGLALGVDVDEQRESKRLVNNGVLNLWYLTMPEFGTRYREGDYVRILTWDYSKYAKDLYYKNNIFEIERIEGDQLFLDDNSTMIKFEDIEELVPFGAIEAVPLDGKHEQHIYNNPIIAASTVLP